MKAPQIVVVSIIVKDDKFLLVKRAREPFKDYWGFIGGLAVMNEKFSSDPLQVSRDEVKCDLQCEFVNSKFYDYSFREKDLSLCLFFYGQIKGTPVISPKYISDYKWFSLEEAQKLDLSFEHNEILEKFSEFMSE